MSQLCPPPNWNSISINPRPYVCILAARVAAARQIGADASPTRRAFAARTFAEARQYFANRKPVSR